MSYKYMGEGAAETMVSALTAMELKIAANREAALAEVDSSVSAAEARLKTLVGTPLVAATAADMTNTEKLYIYTGSESGYTYGNWYYYDGTTWTSGGMYNSPELETDKTLSVIDRPADAKATGDEISSVKNALNQKIDDVQINGASIVENGVANVPVAGPDKYGAIQVSGYGLQMQSNGYISTKAATSSEVKNGQRSWEHIAPGSQHQSTFYGLAKAAGSDEKNSTLPVGTYTEEAKAAIRQMLGVETGNIIVEQVSGSTPVINGIADHRYICGEVSTITITPPASGIIDVVFTSGSTAALLTVPSTVTFPAWFDATELGADTVYEINIADGTYGAVMTWPV